MIDFLKKLFKAESSSTTARERLRLVLLSDHLALAPDVVESLKTDLLAVISRYVEVDAPNMDVTFEQRDREVAMLANIPIKSMRSRPLPPAPPRPPAPPEPPEGVPPAVATAETSEPEVATLARAEAAPVTTTMSAAAARRRRRRRPRIHAAPATG